MSGSDHALEGVAEPGRQIHDVRILGVLGLEHVGEFGTTFPDGRPGGRRKTERGGDPGDTSAVLDRPADTSAVVDVTTEPIRRLEHVGEEAVDRQTLDLLESLVGRSRQQVLDDEFDLLLVGLVTDQIPIGIELVGHAGRAQPVGQLRLQFAGPTVHLEGDLGLIGVEFRIGRGLDLLDQCVDLFLRRPVGQQRGALPRVDDRFGEKELGEHRAALERPFMQLVGQPFTLVVVDEGGRFRRLLLGGTGASERVLEGRHVGSCSHVDTRCGGNGGGVASRTMAISPLPPDRNLALELVRVTEAAAIAASRFMGRGDKEGADGAAVDAMRAMLSSVSMDGVVVIGEGEKDEAPMLFNGERIGDGTHAETDIAVDPIDGTTLTALGRANALAVIAVAPRGTMFDPGPCMYMEKLAVGPDAVGAIDLQRSLTDNLHAVADASREEI